MNQHYTEHCMVNKCKRLEMRLQNFGKLSQGESVVSDLKSQSSAPWYHCCNCVSTMNRFTDAFK